MTQYGYSNNTSVRSNPQNQNQQATQQEQGPVVDGKVDFSKLNLPSVGVSKDYVVGELGGKEELRTLSKSEIKERAKAMYDAGLDGSQGLYVVGGLYQDIDNSVIEKAFTKTITSTEGKEITGVKLSPSEIEDLKKEFNRIVKTNNGTGDFDQIVATELWDSNEAKLRHLYTSQNTQVVLEDLKTAMVSEDHDTVNKIISKASGAELKQMALEFAGEFLDEDLGPEERQLEANKIFLASIQSYQNNSTWGLGSTRYASDDIVSNVGQKLHGVSKDDQSVVLAGDLHEKLINQYTNNHSKFVEIKEMLGVGKKELSLEEATKILNGVKSFDQNFAGNFGGSLQAYVEKELTSIDSSAWKKIEKQLQRAKNVIENHKVLEGVNAEVERLKEKYGEDSITDYQQKTITNIQKQLEDPDIERGKLPIFLPKIKTFEADIKANLIQGYEAKVKEFNQLASGIIGQTREDSYQASDFIKDLSTPLAHAFFDVSETENRALRENKPHDKDKSATGDVRKQLENNRYSANEYKEKLIEGVEQLKQTYPKTYNLLESSIGKKVDEISSKIGITGYEIQSTLEEFERDIIESRQTALANILLDSKMAHTHGLEISKINYVKAANAVELVKREAYIKILYDGLRDLYEADKKAHDGKISYFNDIEENTSRELLAGFKDLVPKSMEQYRSIQEKIFSSFMQERENFSKNVREN